MKVYLNDEKKSVDPGLLYDILQALKVLFNLRKYLIFEDFSIFSLSKNYELEVLHILVPSR